jgi:hypothetical protein
MNAHADRIFARGALLILGLLFGAAVASASGLSGAGIVELLVTGIPLLAQIPCYRRVDSRIVCE